MREAPGARADRLVAALRPKTLLLVLDNCEHVVGAAAPLVEAAAARPGLRVLATSRARLRGGRERVPVPPAGPPRRRRRRCGAATATTKRCASSSSGRAPRGRTSPSRRRTPALAEICRRLDGIPLALELAAARVRVFSVEQIAARLDDRFRLLTAGPRTALPRQQTLRATVDWSYALLAEPERALLRRLAVFAGGWTFEAAEAVAAGDGIQPYAVLDLLAQLVDKSLVLAEERRGRRSATGCWRPSGSTPRDRLQEAGEAGAHPGPPPGLLPRPGGGGRAEAPRGRVPRGPGSAGGGARQPAGGPGVEPRLRALAAGRGAPATRRSG